MSSSAPLPDGLVAVVKQDCPTCVLVAPVLAPGVTPLGVKSLEMTGEIADGWLGTSFIPEHADAHLAHIAKGAARAGR